MSSPDVIPSEFNFLTPLVSYLFIVSLHFFLTHFTYASRIATKYLVKDIRLARLAESKNNIILRVIGAYIYRFIGATVMAPTKAEA